MKLYAGSFVLITFISLIMMSFVYNEEYKKNRMALIEEADKSLEFQSDVLLKELDILSKDLLFLSNNIVVKYKYDNDESLKSLVNFMQLKFQYDQLRFINLDGMEILRINQGIPPVLVAKDKLQSKKDREYVKQGLKIEKNEILLSPLNLNQENGVVEIPHKPTLRLITPSFNKDGKKEGLFIINLNASTLLSYINKMQGSHLSHISKKDSQVNIMMSNAKGEWLLAPKDDVDFGFDMQNVGNELLKYNAKLWEAVNSSEIGTLATSKSDIVFKNIYPLNEIQIPLDKKSSEALVYSLKSNNLVWRLIIEIPSETVHSLTKNYFYKLFPYAIAFWLVLQILSIILIRNYYRNKEQYAELLLMATALENSEDGVIVTDTNGLIIRLNKSYCKISGYSEKELIGKNPRTIGAGWTEDSVYKNMWDSLDSIGYWEGELKDRNKNGQIYVIWLRIVKVIDDDSKKTYYVGILTNITEKKEHERKIVRLAYRDALTNLPNRSLFYDRLGKAITERRNSEEKLAVMFIDLDNFKFVNDSAGHIVGDKFLIEVSRRFKETLREYDTLARVGGDEFIILLEKVKSTTIVDVAYRLIESVSTSIKIDNHEFFTSASIGISVFPDDGLDQETLIKHADIAMYEAKNSGKNQYIFFLKAMNDEVSRRSSIESNLSKAIENNEFSIYYQPQINSISNTLIGAEALLRWNNKNLGSVSPAEFIPICEATSKIVSITEWIIAQVCRDIHKMKETYNDEFRVSINISSVHMLNDDFVEKIDNIVKSHSILPSQIELEITEGALIKNTDESTKKINTLKNLGYSISIDDFGTGYSSLSYLKNFPFDKLKIDQSFVRSLPNDTQDIGIVRSIIGIANALNLNVIAEGVETKENLDFLNYEGCSLIQGYYYSKPLPLDEYIRFIECFKK